ncbi:hypothetical protein JCM8097_007597 [Rhodosporidiobolus ruineniae]
MATPAPPPADDSQAPVEDGPLFRSHLASLEKRAHFLRHALKKLQRSLDASLSALQASVAAQSAVDDALEELSVASLTSQTDVLGGLYDRELRAAREDARSKAAGELERGKEMSERVKGAVERLKGVDERRKAFESDTKKYYDELQKYLSRTGEKDDKVAAHDAKQAERVASFRQQRVEYFAFLEGLVETEESAVAAWIRSWADVDGSAEQQSRDRARQASLAALEGSPVEGRAPIKPRGSAGSSKDGWIHVGGTPGYSLNSEPAPTDSATTSTPSSSAHGHGGGESTSPAPATPASDEDKNRRRRRSSIPHFHLPGGGGGPTSPAPEPRERESSGKRDRFKGFLKTAQNALESALPASVSSPNLAADVFARRPSPPPPVPALAPSPPTQPAPSPASTSTALSPPPLSSFPRSTSTTQLRRKEGFLYATEAGQKHTTAGDGGARWNRYWVTLAEGQLVEYDKWQDAMSVHGTPINLRYATARLSKAENAAGRRFAFEVLTPTIRRVFQAASEAECQEWVAAISKSVESLLNGTSSVRYFDASRLTGTATPYSLNEFGSSASLALSKPSSSTSSHPDPPLPTSPKSSRLPDFLTRRASLGHGRKTSLSGPSGVTSKKDKRRSVQSPPIPSLTIGEESSSFPSFGDGAPVDRAFFDASTRRGLHAFSEGNEADSSSPSSRPSLNGLGIPFPGYGPGAAAGASKSSPDLLGPGSGGAAGGGGGGGGMRSASAPFTGHGSSEGSETGAVVDDDGVTRREGQEEEDDTDAASQLSAQDRAIGEVVRGWASSDETASASANSTATRSVESELAAKYRNASRIVESAERSGVEWQNDRCADCREEGPRWASWSLGITLCIRCSGVHRSLGTHVSKVRSVELDDWSDEQLAHMEAVGNARSNAFYEARLPAGTVEALTESTVASFIREKYVDKRWTPSPDAVPPSASSPPTVTAAPPPPSIST